IKRLERRVKSYSPRVSEVSSKRAPRSVWCKYHNCVTTRATFISLCRHEEIPRSVKSEADGKFDAGESRRADKNTRRTCRRKLEDGLIRGVRGKEIACSIKGEAETLPGKRTKRALGSVRRKFENGAGKDGTVLIKRHDKHVAYPINRESFGCEVTTADAADGGRVSLYSAGTDFHNARLKGAGHRIPGVNRDVEIALIDRQTPRSRETGSKRALRSRRHILEDRAAGILRIAINRSE